MATMATGHALSVLANNSVKSPINVRNNNVTPCINRHGAYSDFNYTDARNVKSGIKGAFGANGDTDYTSVPVYDSKELAEKLKGLPDDEFYERLFKMKEHQKETLEKCEQLYLEKKALEDKYANLTRDHSVGNAGDIFLDENVNIDTRTVLVNGTLIGPTGTKFDSNGHFASTSKENVQDLSSKPPIPPSPARPPSRQGKRQVAVGGTVKDLSLAEYSSPAMPRWRVERSRSWDGGDDRYLTDSGDEYRDSEDNKMIDELFDDETRINPNQFLRSQEIVTPSKLELARIESMWDNFSIRDYMPRDRPSSAPSVRSAKQKKASEWRHKLTIPQPFNMMIREETKDKKKSIIQAQVEQERLEKEMQEELECQKKFRAKPVPAHIYLPLYDEINKKNEARRIYAKEYSKQLLKSQEKPFKFMKREQQKTTERRNSEPINNIKKSKSSHSFKASPVPSFVYEDKVSRKQREEEEYRKLRISMRSEELLKEASLPPSMAAREKSKANQKEEERRRSRARTKFRPKVHKHVPDYDGLYKKFQQELNRKKNNIQPTVVEPFHLETEHIQPSKEKILRDIARDEEVLTENRWPYKAPRSRSATPRSSYYWSTSLDSIPAKMTKAADKRQATIRKSIEKLTEYEKQEMENERKRRIRESKFRQSIKDKVGYVDRNHTDLAIKERLRNFKETDRQRQEQYQAEIEEMKEKVNKQPLLFERQRQLEAKKKITKKFADTLKNHGLDEDFINSKSTAASSIQADTYDDDYEEDYDRDETYVKSSSPHQESQEEY